MLSGDQRGRGGWVEATPINIRMLEGDALQVTRGAEGVGWRRRRQKKNEDGGMVDEASPSNVLMSAPPSGEGSGRRSLLVCVSV